MREAYRIMGSSSFFLLVIAVFMGFAVTTNEANLSYNYYQHSCPYVESIVRAEVLGLSMTDVTTPPAFLRLLFHDCQVQGCDASILLNSRELAKKPEMVSSRNFGVRKLENIEHIKAVLEVECPRQVSCADIIALAAKDSVFLAGGPDIAIPLGRKDSVTSSSRQADAHIPVAGIGVDDLLRIFASYRMSLEESISMLGAHTLGVGHCVSVVDRLYNRKPSDHMSQGFGQLLRLTCPTKAPRTNLTVVPNDMTPLMFDNQYFKDILLGRGLLAVDTGIARDPRTRLIVGHFARDQNHFFRVFSSAFVKLSSTRVLVGEEGEVRRQCLHKN